MNGIDDANLRMWTNELRIHELLYPDDRVVALLSRAYPAGGTPEQQALDIGFGSGRHLRLLLDYGFTTHGIELIDNAVRAASERFGSERNLGRLLTADVADAPFETNSMETLIAWGVLFLRRREEIDRDLRATARLLRPGGSLIVNFRTPDNWFAQLGRRIGGDSINLDDRAGPYSGATYTFMSRDQAAQTLESAGLEIADAERLDLLKGPEQRHHSWWLFRAVRP